MPPVADSTLADGIVRTSSYQYDDVGRMTRATETASGIVDERVDYACNNDGSVLQIKRYADDGVTQGDGKGDISEIDSIGKA
jgi:hypothetical protein